MHSGLVVVDTERQVGLFVARDILVVDIIEHVRVHLKSLRRLDVRCVQDAGIESISLALPCQILGRVRLSARPRRLARPVQQHVAGRLPVHRLPFVGGHQRRVPARRLERPCRLPVQRCALPGVRKGRPVALDRSDLRFGRVGHDVFGHQ